MGAGCPTGSCLLPWNVLLHDDELSLDALTSGVEVFQRRKGHRFSSDDVVTAWVALQQCPSPRRGLDLGCGLGSVVLHLAWCVPEATFVGVEAQAVSFALLERNIAHNRLGDRIKVHHGDLRDASTIDALGGPFDLVTGTPPYFPVTTASDALDTQRAYARIEYRGGIEAYVEAAAKVVSNDGWVVLCGDADAEHRLEHSASAADLTVRGRYVVVPRSGRPPLFTVWALRHSSTIGAGDTMVDRTLELRDADGERTDDARMMRAFSGFPEKPTG